MNPVSALLDTYPPGEYDRLSMTDEEYNVEIITFRLTPEAAEELEQVSRPIHFFVDAWGNVHGGLPEQDSLVARCPECGWDNDGALRAVVAYDTRYMKREHAWRLFPEGLPDDADSPGDISDCRSCGFDDVDDLTLWTLVPRMP